MARPNRHVQNRQDFTAEKQARVLEERAARSQARDREMRQHAEMLELAGAMHSDRTAWRARETTREYWVELGFISAEPTSPRLARIRAYAVPLDVLLADVKPMSFAEEMEFMASFKAFEPLSDDELNRL